MLILADHKLATFASLRVVHRMEMLVCIRVRSGQFRSREYALAFTSDSGQFA